METIFENQYIRSKEFFNKYYCYVFFKRPVSIVVNILYVLMFVIGILLTIFQGGLFSIFYICFPLLLRSTTILRFLRGKKLRYNQDLETNCGVPVEIRLSVTENEIEILNISKESKTIIPFTQIKKLIRTKNLYIMITQSKLGIIFVKDCFIKGTFEEFERFLNNKGFKC